MQSKRVLVGVLALTMAVSMFASCGNVDDSKSSKEATSAASTDGDKQQVSVVPASDILDTEITKMTDYFKGDLKSGSVSVSVKSDIKNTDEKFSWDKMSSLSADEVDMEMALNAGWDADVADVSLTVGDSSVFALGTDTDNIYIDLSGIKTIMQATNAWNESYEDNSQGYSFADCLTTIKLNKNDVTDLLSSTGVSAENAENAENTDMKAKLDSSVKAVFNDEVVAELKKLGEKAEYDGHDIVIKDLKKEDFEGLSSALSKAAESADVPYLANMFDGSNYIDAEIAPNEGTTASSELTEKTLEVATYTLSYDANTFKQTHTFVIDSDAAVRTITFTITDKADVVTVDKYSNAATIEEVTNGAMTTKDFLGGIATSMLGNMSVPNVDEDYNASSADTRLSPTDD